MFEGLFRSKNKRWQVIIRDDANATFRQLDIVDALVVETKQDNKNKDDPAFGWIDDFRTLWPFKGFKSIPAGSVQVACYRTPLLDVWGILPEDSRIKDNKKLNEQPVLRDIARSRRRKLERTVKGKNYNNIIVIFCGTGMLIEIVGMLIRVAAKGGG